MKYRHREDKRREFSSHSNLNQVEEAASVDYEKCVTHSKCNTWSVEKGKRFRALYLQSEDIVFVISNILKHCFTRAQWIFVTYIFNTMRENGSF